MLVSIKGNVKSLTLSNWQCRSQFFILITAFMRKRDWYLLSKTLSPFLFSEKILTYCLFWGIYDIRLSLTLNSELLRYKNSLIDSKKTKTKKNKKKKKKNYRKFYGGWKPMRQPLYPSSDETCFSNFFSLTSITLISLNTTHMLLTYLKRKVCSLTKKV